MRARQGFLWALLVIPALAWAGSAEDHVRVAQKLMRRGRMKDAKVELLVAQKLAPQREDVKQWLAQLDGSTPTAAVSDETTTAEAGTASQLEAVLAQARAAYRESELKAAAEAWHRAQLLAPKDKEAADGLARLDHEAYHRDSDQPFDQSVADLYDAGMREARKGRLVEAKAKLDQALALNPTQPQLKDALAGLAPAALEQQAGRDAEQWVLDGQVALKSEDWAKAGHAFQEALKQAPNLNAAKSGLAIVKARGAAQAKRAMDAGQQALDQGRWDDAERQFSLAMALNPEQEGAVEGKQAALNKAAKAKSRAQQSQEADKLYNAGVEAWSAGDLGLAASRFRDVLKLAPEDSEAQKALMAVRRKLDERAEKDRLDAIHLVEEARNLENRGAPEEALKRYERALAKDPSQGEAAKGKERLMAELKAP